MNAARADLTHTLEDGPGRARSSRPRSARAGLAVALAAATGLATLTLAVVGMGTASASTLNGVATTATPSNDSYLASGGSNTDFTLTLPSGAACTGDTAHDGYHVWSYLVKQSATISATTFSAETGPSQGYGLYESDLNYYGPVNTAQTTGQVIGIPNDFQWGAGVSGGSFTAAELLYTGGNSGVWEGGLACANSSGDLTDNWNTQVTFTKSTSDPNGFTWSAVPGPAGSAVAAITSANNATFTEGTTGSFTPTATGTPTPTITESGALPSGVTFAGGVLSGDPSVTGTFPITFTATNGIGNPATQNFTLTVSGAAALTITTTSLPAATIGTPYSYAVSASGGKAPYKWKATGLPKGLKMKSGVIKGTVKAKKPPATGPYSVTLTVSDKSKPKQTATKTLTLTLNPA